MQIMIIDHTVLVHMFFEYFMSAWCGYCLLAAVFVICSCISLHCFKFVYHLQLCVAFSALMLLVWRQEGHPAWWGAGMVICLELGADLHMAQLMPLPLTVSCFSKIQIGFAFLVPAHPGSPGKRAVKRVCVAVMCSASSHMAATNQ